MIKMNKYLKEIGIDENSFPFKDTILNTRLFNDGKPCDTRYVELAPLKDGRIIEGFIHAHCYGLDNIFSLIIYSHLCYFKEFVSDYKSDEFNKILDIMIEGFRISIKYNSYDMSKTQKRKIKRAWKLLADYNSNLWY